MALCLLSCSSSGQDDPFIPEPQQVGISFGGNSDPGRMLILVQKMVKRDWKVFFLPLKFGDTRPKMKMEAPTLLSKT